MLKYKVISKTEQETRELAAKIITHLKPGDVVLLTGDLGAGKTTFVGGALARLGYKDHVISPTFNILKCYFEVKPNVFHMTKKDSWCQAFVSACFIANAYSSLVPIECSCQRAINKAKSMGIVHNNDYNAKIGDLIYYDWDGNGTVEHVGIVTNVIYNNYIVCEGNYSDMVKERTINRNDRRIRFIVAPRYTV